MFQVFVDGDNSKQILINRWKQLPYLGFVILLAVLLILKSCPPIKARDIIFMATRPLTIFMYGYLLAMIYIGYYYPVDRLSWGLMQLGWFFPVLVMVHNYVH